MSRALMRGRTLSQKAVEIAKFHRDTELKKLLEKDRVMLTAKERSLARKLSKKFKFWEVNNDTIETS